MQIIYFGDGNENRMEVGDLRCGNGRGSENTAPKIWHLLTPLGFTHIPTGSVHTDPTTGTRVRLLQNDHILLPPIEPTDYTMSDDYGVW